MKKILSIIAITIVFFVIYFLQINLFNWFNIYGISPNLFIIFILLLITSFMLFNKNLFSILPIIITKSFYALIIVIIFDIINVLILENKSLKKSIISFIKKQEM